MTDQKTHWKKTMNPNYLGAYALEPNQDLIVKITDVKTESVMNADGRNEECLVAYLENQKPLNRKQNECESDCESGCGSKLHRRMDCLLHFALYR